MLIKTSCLPNAVSVDTGLNLTLKDSFNAIPGRKLLSTLYGAIQADFSFTASASGVG